ncbi:MATE efflux family protein [Meredithblackwellia eburnea MCA 4105]
MFSNYPGSSPSSYPGDTSFLQRAALQGRASLSQPNGHSLDPASAAISPGGEDIDDRGRSAHKLTGSGRASVSSAYSASRSRLSPTEEEDDSASERLRDVNSDYEDEDEGTRASGSSYALGGQPVLPPSHLLHSQLHQPTVPPTESTPLLGAPSALEPIAKDKKTAAKQELSILLKYMVPICGTHFLEYSLLVVTVISVGHLGTVELAASSLASMTSNVVALSVIQGFCTALDTLCPQAYTSKPKDTSLYALRTFFLLLCLIVPQTIIFWNSEVILLGLKQDPRVAERAATYLKVLSFGLPGYAGFECIRRWLQAQGLMLAPVITLIVAAPLNVVLNYLLVWGPDSVRLGFIGAPLATAISMTSMFLVSIFYSIFYAPRDAWGGFSLEVFRNWGINTRLGLAGTAMVASEWWCWEIVGLGSSFLGPESLAAQSILLTSASLFYQIPYALSVAGAVRVGNLLGAQRPIRAQTASRVTMAIAAVVACINSIVLVLARHSWGGLFSSEPDVIAIVARVLPLVALFQLTDGLSGATGGVLRGAGRATLGALINLTSYYVIGLPFGLCMAFLGPKLGLVGLWLGLTIALTFTALLMCTFIWNLDWKVEAENTRIRMGIVKNDGEEEP